MYNTDLRGHLLSYWLYDWENINWAMMSPLAPSTTSSKCYSSWYRTPNQVFHDNKTGWYVYYQPWQSPWLSEHIYRGFSLLIISVLKKRKEEKSRCREGCTNHYSLLRLPEKCADVSWCYLSHFQNHCHICVLFPIKMQCYFLELYKNFSVERALI